MIRNITTGKVLAQKHKRCDTLWSQARGLMFSGRKAVVMDLGAPRKVSLHMMFVFFPIDVLYADEKKQVVEIKRDFRPFSFHNPTKTARYIVELPYPGGAETHIKDLLQF